MNLYNDNDPCACAWLSELITAQQLPPGDVNSTTIHELHHANLAAYTQVHLFAGIGGWPYALKLAGWPDDLPVWTGSCPCQPFSCAGKGAGASDPRHLWPVMRDLIALHRPTVVFGEQVASKAGRVWLAGVRADLEAMGYAVGASDLCAAGVGAPHIRQRLYWVAFSQRDAGEPGRVANESREGAGANGSGAPDQLGRPGVLGGLDDSTGARHAQTWSGADVREERSGECVPCDTGGIGGLDNTPSMRWQNGAQLHRQHDGEIAVYGRELSRLEYPTSRGANAIQQPGQLPSVVASSQASYWHAHEWLPCLDNRTRRIEPGSFPLAHGVSGRVGLLRGYGNAIVPQLAAEFIGAFLDTLT